MDVKKCRQCGGTVKAQVRLCPICGAVQPGTSSRARTGRFNFLTVSVGIAIILLTGFITLFPRNDDKAPATSVIPSGESTPSFEILQSPALAGGRNPNLSSTADGTVFLSWIEPADSGVAVRVASFSSGQWSAAHTVHQGRDVFVNWADFPSVTALDAKRVAVHWLQSAGKTTTPYGARVALSLDGGATWTRPVVPYSNTSGSEYGFVSMWPEGTDGKFGVAWLDGRRGGAADDPHGVEMMLMAAAVSPGGTASSETQLDARVCECCQTAAAVTSKGPIIAYRDRSNEEIRDIYVTRRIGEKWSAGKSVHADNWKFMGCPVNGPAMTALGDRVALAWFTGADDRPRVNISFSDDAGAGFSTPIRVDSGSAAGYTDAALLPDGSAMVMWLEHGKPGMNLLLRHVDRSGKLGPIRRVDSISDPRSGGLPRLAVTASEAFIAGTRRNAGKTEVRLVRARLADLM
jgi:hypothetical protein